MIPKKIYECLISTRKAAETSLISGEMQMKTGMRYLDSLTRMAIIQKHNNTPSADEDGKKLELLCMAHGTVTRYSHFQKQSGSFFKS